MTNPDQRARFEAWLLDRYGYVDRCRVDTVPFQLAWDAFQAAEAATVERCAAGVERMGDMNTPDDVAEALRKNIDCHRCGLPCATVRLSDQHDEFIHSGDCAAAVRALKPD